MAGKGKGKRKARAGGAGAKAKRVPRSPKPALGNDPFERGAAVRAPVVERGEKAKVKPAAAAVAEAAREEGEAAAREAVAEATASAMLTATPTSTPTPAPAESETEAVSTPRAPTPAALRAQIEAVEERVERELGRAAEAAASAAARLGELARAEAAGEHARDAVEVVTNLLPSLRERLAGLASLRRLFEGPGELDFFGMDRDLVERAAPVADFLYASWWRVATRDIERVPSEGPVVIVANHGGSLPWDALVLRLALQRDHSAHRDLRPLLDEHALRMPIAGGLWTRLGAVPATPDNALRLLGERRVIAVFPEGSRTGERPWPDRYKVQRFGRGGFTKLALRTGAAIVPCAIVGSEEASAPFARPGWVAERLGFPALAGPRMPLAPLGLLPLPSRWSLRFAEPIDTAGLGAGAASDPAHVLELTERARAALQDMLDEDVAARRTVYL
jgi:1-acyl-sn-glycerol-3-phosphate acyltransferase